LTATGYAFRDTLEAAARLGVLAEVFEPASRPFLRELGPRQAALAYDLGCGPGFTTRLVADQLQPRLTVGLDESENFVALARQNFPDLRFEVHDATRPRLPAGEGDVIYCRMLLTHLPDYAAALETWARALLPGGRLLVDEVERIETDEPVFTEYLAQVTDLLASRGGRLYIGEELDRARPRGLRRLESRATVHGPDPRAAAGLFRMNLAVWGPERLELDRDLYRIVRSGGGAITWTMRQIAYERE